VAEAFPIDGLAAGSPVRKLIELWKVADVGAAAPSPETMDGALAELSAGANIVN